MSEMALILFLCGLPVLWILILVFCSSLKIKKGRVAGLTIPAESGGDTDMAVILRRSRKTMLICGFILTILLIPIFFAAYDSVVFFLWMVWLTAAIAVPMILYGHYFNCLKKLKMIRGWEFTAEERYWFWGFLYYNKSEPKVFVNGLPGSGTNGSFNLARFSGKVIMSLVALCVLTLPLWGVWIMAEEFTEAKVTVSEISVDAVHLNTEYTVAFEDVEQVALLREMPQCRRNNGYETAHFLKGNFTVKGYGKSYVCVDIRDEAILALETAEKTYLISFDTEKEALAVIDQIHTK